MRVRKKKRKRGHEKRRGWGRGEESLRMIGKRGEVEAEKKMKKNERKRR